METDIDNIPKLRLVGWAMSRSTWCQSAVAMIVTREFLDSSTADHEVTFPIERSDNIF